ncbi:hypothetical protein PVAND_015505 [Polypedilum vanderplanki]|uniref:Uncharacterized protein n=1 Tax=Polypedilum vanderplanki TaxID=319348 RepID=A0A9J6BD99_POLVA|nr:hypothetical protein PVAND_015505 [Polypedilum vanderplanki]
MEQTVASWNDYCLVDATNFKKQLKLCTDNRKLVSSNSELIIISPSDLNKIESVFAGSRRLLSSELIECNWLHVNVIDDII